MGVAGAPGAWANAEGPGTPQATAANATFLSNAPAPPGGAAGVCVIDSGADTDTDLGPALAGRTALLGGVPGDPSDQGATLDTGVALSKHGTYVAGVIASQVDGVGTSGIWPAARVFSTRVFTGGATAAAADYIRAMNWCSSQPGVTVINLSLSGLGTATLVERQQLDNKIAEVRGPLHNINVVGAAGNNGSMTAVGYPANAVGVFAVGATDAAGVLAPFSNRGSGLDIAAFGINSCLTTNRGTHLAHGSGTSYAAPVVSAVLAAMRSYDSTLTPDTAEQRLLDNADVVDGVKVLNAAKAFRSNPATAARVPGAPVTGLGAAVADACEPPLAPSGGGGTSETQGIGSKAVDPAPPPGTTATVEPVAAPVIDRQPRARDTFAVSKPPKPTLKSTSMRRGVLTVRISGRKAGDRAVFRVAGRTYVRMSSTLRLRVRGSSWKAVRVRLQRPGGGFSRTLVIRDGREF
ncbi:S8 family peptidase [Capillimicrobium parvum]|uniref:S8 family peptidase n=1 Tax=Capillimicrobium parvum TaxID=2884022 RepID=UPI00216B38F5|nr:S8 family serine peptidase [Capillimicrobium parvum]